MPRVNRVNSARKEQGKCGKCGTEIKAGDAYVWWKFRYGGRRVRCAKPECGPKGSDLTQSEFLGWLSDLQERTFTNDDADTLQSEVEDAISEIQNMADELRSKLDNMPYQLQDSDTGQLLQERIDALDSAVSDLESIDVTTADDVPDEPERNEGESDEDFEKRVNEYEEAKEEIENNLEELADEASNAISDISCG